MSAEVRPGSGPMFDHIARRYDVLNRLTSLGVDKRWRGRAVKALGPTAGRILDLATGTADFAIALAESNPTAEVDGLDPSPKMLEIGREKVCALGLGSRVRLRQGSAEHLLDYEAGTFDAVTIGFGIRNFEDRRSALREILRVTKPSGRLVILELSTPKSGVMSRLARIHINHVVPMLGRLLSDAQAYRYLPNSISAFPSPRLFSEEIASEGFSNISAIPLTFGAATIFHATKREGGSRDVH